MALTVRELISIPTLRTRVLAGASGVDRQVEWAHSCELPEPWQWMGAGDLLMTVGHGFPNEAADQAAYIEQLAEAELSGLVLAEGLFAPSVTEQAVQAADRLAFPLLETAYEVPFVVVARAVADSNRLEAHARLTRVLRLYDTFRLATADAAEDSELFARLARDVGTALYVIDLEAATVAVSSGEPLSEKVVVGLVNELRGQRQPLPALVRARVDTLRFVVLPLATGARWALATPLREQVTDLVVLGHVATIAFVHMERQRANAIARLHAGSRLLNQLVAVRMDSEFAAEQLRAQGMSGPPWWVVLIADAVSVDLVQRLLLAQGVPHILDRINQGVLVLTDVAPEAGGIRRLVPSAFRRVGVSDPVTSLSRIPQGVREARWALEAGPGRKISMHGVDHALFLPRTVSEGEEVVGQVLGPVLAYDREHGSDLLESLRVFFATQRSWQAAAKRLNIHKQTLIYRMRRVEEITGRRLDTLDDIVELHLALRTQGLLGERP